MRSFCDRNGRAWEITLTIGSAKRVKEALDVDLLEPMKGDPPLVAKVSADIELFCNVLWALCRPAAEVEKVSPETFSEALGGDAIGQAIEAFFAEWIDFFLLVRRPETAKVIQKQRDYQVAILDRAAAALDAPELTEAVETAICNAEKLGVQQASSVLTKLQGLSA